MSFRFFEKVIIVKKDAVLHFFEKAKKEAFDRKTTASGARI
jgi:hypothetical protein